jgi:hypothetical protein
MARLVRITARKSVFVRLAQFWLRAAILTDFISPPEPSQNRHAGLDTFCVRPAMKLVSSARPGNYNRSSSD